MEGFTAGMCGAGGRIFIRSADGRVLSDRTIKDDQRTPRTSAPPGRGRTEGPVAAKVNSGPASDVCGMQGHIFDVRDRQALCRRFRGFGPDAIGRLMAGTDLGRPFCPVEWMLYHRFG